MTAAPPHPAASAGSDARPRIQVVRGTADPVWPAIVAIRQRVFGREQGIAEAAASDPDDAASIHAVAWLVGDGADGSAWQPVGTGRLTLHRNGRNEALIAWVATLPGHRHRGIGTAIMEALLDEADVAEIGETFLAAQQHAEGFYGRLGFFAVGAPYAVQGIPHRWMVRQRKR